MGLKQEVAFTSRRDVFKRLSEIGRVSSLTPDQLRSYEADIKIARDYHNELEGARIEGLEEGRAEGIELGRQEGAWENLRNIVFTMRSKGMDNDTIASLVNQPADLISSI